MDNMIDLMGIKRQKSEISEKALKKELNTILAELEYLDDQIEAQANELQGKVLSMMKRIRSILET